MSKSLASPYPPSVWTALSQALDAASEARNLAMFASGPHCCPLSYIVAALYLIGQRPLSLNRPQQVGKQFPGSCRLVCQIRCAALHIQPPAGLQASQDRYTRLTSKFSRG